MHDELYGCGAYSQERIRQDKPKPLSGSKGHLDEVKLPILVRNAERDQNRDKPTTNPQRTRQFRHLSVPLYFLVRLSSPPVLHPCFTSASQVWRSVRCSLFPGVNSLNFTCHRLRARNAALLSGRFHLADAYLKYPRYTLGRRRRPASWRREMGIVGRSSRNCSDDSYSFENGIPRGNSRKITLSVHHHQLACPVIKCNNKLIGDRPTSDFW